MDNFFLHLLWWFIFLKVMSFFTGEYDCKLDAKGRLVLPAKIKANLPEASVNTEVKEIVLSKGLDPNIIIYPILEYRKIHNKISALNDFNPEQRAFKRNFFRNIAHVELDSNGRFIVPKAMMVHAQLDREAVIVGMGNIVELWSPPMYEKFLINDPQEYSELAQKYMDS